MPFFAERSIYIGYYTPLVTTPSYPYPGLVPYATPGVDTLGLDVALPSDAFPTMLRSEKRNKNMPDFIAVNGFLVVCAEFRDMVEELEPGTHQFSPVLEVIYLDGRPTEKTFHAVVIRRHLKGTVIPHLCTPKLSAGGKFMTIMDLASYWKDHLVLDEEKVSDRHLWKDRDFHPSSWFMSDELTKRVRKAKLKGLELTRHRLGRLDPAASTASPRFSDPNKAALRRAYGWGEGEYILSGPADHVNTHGR